MRTLGAGANISGLVDTNDCITALTMTSAAPHDSIAFSEFYPGGEPPLYYFYGQVQEIQRLAAGPSTSEATSVGIMRLCLIGLASHFEAFCKAHFAAVVNIHPPVLKEFAEKRQDVALRLTEILQVLPDMNHRIGSLLSEQPKFEWGSAKDINGLFCDLLGITTFSKDEAEQFHEFISDRNLLVHHGGIFTLRYERQRLVDTKRPDGTSSRVLKVEKEDIQRWSTLLLEVAQKLADSSVKVMEKKTEGLNLGDKRSIAINLLSVT
jgi:hypothetical protein